MAGTPATATLVANTAQTVIIDGVWPVLEIVPLASNLQVVFAIGNGTTATLGTATEFACPPFLGTVIPVASTNGTDTRVSIISATAGQVQVRVPQIDPD